MRVMQLVLSLEPGGTERLVIELARRLVHAAEMSVCCLDARGAWADELTDSPVRVWCLDRRPGFRPSLAYKLGRILNAEKIDVVHCHHYSSFVYGQLAAVLRPKTRVVFTEHGRLSDAGPSRKRQWINPWLARFPQHVFAVSADLRRHMCEEGFPESRVEVVYNGIDPGQSVVAADRESARLELGIPACHRVFGTVGRLDPVKDLPTMIKAFGQVRQSTTSSTLVIVGDGPEASSLKALAEAEGLAEHVRFTGYRGDVRRLLSAFDVYVNSSIHEGVSLTILEAMATSLPVVATRVGGNPEVVVDQLTGVMVPARDIEALAGALTSVGRDSTHSAAMGHAGRARVLERFTIDRMVARYLDSYRQAAN